MTVFTDEARELEVCKIFVCWVKKEEKQGESGRKYIRL